MDGGRKRDGSCASQLAPACTEHSAAGHVAADAPFNDPIRGIAKQPSYYLWRFPIHDATTPYANGFDDVGLWTLHRADFLSCSNGSLLLLLGRLDLLADFFQIVVRFKLGLYPQVPRRPAGVFLRWRCLHIP